MVPLSGCLGSLAPVPVLIALYSAVRQAVVIGGRFLWIENISQPDVALTGIVAALSAAAAALAPQPSAQNKVIMILLPSIITMIALSKMAAGIGIYWGVSSLVGAIQSVVIKRPSLKAA